MGVHVRLQGQAQSVLRVDLIIDAYPGIPGVVVNGIGEAQPGILGVVLEKSQLQQQVGTHAPIVQEVDRIRSIGGTVGI